LRSDLESSQVMLTLRLDGDERSLPPQVHALLVRGLEVALDNVSSHARAKTCEVDLRMAAPVATLRVVDDGIGLFDGTAEPPGFHQIKKLRFRVQELGGSLLVEEHDGGGVCFDLRVPVTQQSL
jgi:signal transduction histidine kinase